MALHNLVLTVMPGLSDACNQLRKQQTKFRTGNDAARYDAQAQLVKLENEKLSVLRDIVMLKEYTETNVVSIDNKLFSARDEVIDQGPGQPAMVRPVVQCTGHGIIFTRIHPDRADTSLILRPRPGWERLRSYMAGLAEPASGRPSAPKKRFEIYVCTAAEHYYAMEAWRILDPNNELIPLDLQPHRIICVPAGKKKHLGDVLGVGDCPSPAPYHKYATSSMPLAVIVDDRLEVWEESARPQVLKVDPYLPHQIDPSAGSGDLYEDALAAEMARVHSNLVATRGSLYLELNRDFKGAVEDVFGQLRQPDFRGDPAAFVQTHLRPPPRVSRFVEHKHLEVPRMMAAAGDAAVAPQSDTAPQAGVALQSAPFAAPAPSQLIAPLDSGIPSQAGHPHNAAADPILARSNSPSGVQGLAPGRSQEGATAAAVPEGPADPRTRKRPLPKPIPRAAKPVDGGMHAQSVGHNAGHNPELSVIPQSQPMGSHQQPAGLASSVSGSDQPSQAVQDSSKRRKLSGLESTSVGLTADEVDADQDSGSDMDVMSSPERPKASILKQPLQEQPVQNQPLHRQLSNKAKKPQLNERIEAKVNELWADAWDITTDTDPPAEDSSGSRSQASHQQKRPHEAASSTNGRGTGNKGLPGEEQAPMMNPSAAEPPSQGPPRMNPDLAQRFAHLSQSGSNALPAHALSGGAGDHLNPVRLPDMSLLANIQALIQLQSSQPPLTSQLSVSQAGRSSPQLTPLTFDPPMQARSNPAGGIGNTISTAVPFGLTTQPINHMDSRLNMPAPPTLPPPRLTPSPAGSQPLPFAKYLPMQRPGIPAPRPPREDPPASAILSQMSHRPVPDTGNTWIRPPPPPLHRPQSRSSGMSLGFNSSAPQGASMGNAGVALPLGQGPSSASPALGQMPMHAAMGPVGPTGNDIGANALQGLRSNGFAIPGLDGLQQRNAPPGRGPSPAPQTLEDLDPMDDDTADLFGLAPVHEASKKLQQKLDGLQQQLQQKLPEKLPIQLAAGGLSAAELLQRQETLSDDFWTKPLAGSGAAQNGAARESGVQAAHRLQAASPSLLSSTSSTQQQQRPLPGLPTPAHALSSLSNSGAGSSSGELFANLLAPMLKKTALPLAGSAQSSPNLPDNQDRQQSSPLPMARPALPRPPPGDPPTHHRPLQALPKAVSGGAQQTSTAALFASLLAGIPAPRPPPGPPPQQQHSAAQPPVGPSQNSLMRPNLGPPLETLLGNNLLGKQALSLQPNPIKQHGAQPRPVTLPPPRPRPPPGEPPTKRSAAPPPGPPPISLKRPSLGPSVGGFPGNDLPGKQAFSMQNGQHLQVAQMAQPATGAVPPPCPPPPRPPPGNPPIAAAAPQPQPLPPRPLVLQPPVYPNPPRLHPGQQNSSSGMTPPEAIAPKPAQLQAPTFQQVFGLSMGQLPSAPGRAPQTLPPAPAPPKIPGPRPPPSPPPIPAPQQQQQQIGTGQKAQPLQARAPASGLAHSAQQLFQQQPHAGHERLLNSMGLLTSGSLQQAMPALVMPSLRAPTPDVLPKSHSPMLHEQAVQSNVPSHISDAADNAAIGTLNHLSQRAKVPLSFNKAALPAGNPHLGHPGWTVEVLWNGEVIGKGHARTNKDAKKIACTGGLAHPLVRASQASLAGQGPGMLPPPMRAGSPSPDLHPAAQPGEPPQGRRSGSRATSPLGLLHADSQPRLVPQVGGASSLPAVEQSEALARLQAMCPGQIEYVFSGAGSVGPSGQAAQPGEPPWFHMCVVYTPFKGQQPFKMVGTGRNHTEAKQVAALRLLQEMGFQVQSSPALPLDGYDEQMHKQTLSSASSRRLPSHSQSTRSLRDSPEYEPYQPSQPASDIEGSSEQEPEPEPDDESDEEGEIEADE